MGKLFKLDMRVDVSLNDLKQDQTVFTLNEDARTTGCCKILDNAEKCIEIKEEESEFKLSQEFKNKVIELFSENQYRKNDLIDILGIRFIVMEHAIEAVDIKSMSVPVYVSIVADDKMDDEEENYICCDMSNEFLKF